MIFWIVILLLLVAASISYLLHEALIYIQTGGNSTLPSIKFWIFVVIQVLLVIVGITILDIQGNNLLG